MLRSPWLDCGVEWDNTDSVPDRFVASSNFRLMVGCEPELELRLKLKPLLMQQPGRYGVASREILNQRLRQPLTLLELRGIYESRPDQCRQVVWNGRSPFYQHGLRRRPF